MKTFTADEFQQKYGDHGVSLFTSTAPQNQSTDQGGAGYVDTVKNNIKSDLNTRVDRTGAILDRKDSSIPEKAVQLLGQGAGLAANTAETVVGNIPGVKQVGEAIGKGIDWLATSELSPIKHLGDFIGNNKALQTATHLYDTDPNFKDSVDAVANIARLGGDVQAAMDSAKFSKNVTQKVMGAIKTGATDTIAPAIEGTISKLGSAAETTKNVVKDVVPSSERLVNSEVTRALDLTQGDVKNINLSTGNDVGKFLADKNLIGGNVADTVKNIDSFYKENHNAVRSEIAKVTDTYKVKDVPRYTEALTEIKKQIQDVAGLQDANTEVDKLLKNKKPTLGDVQRVKELMDQHFSLYKAVGDVKEGVAKTGLAKIRGDLKGFIEKEVKAKTGADIKDLNNNVQTARSISDAVETRSTRGLTRGNISTGDIVTFLTGSGLGGGNPLVGGVAVLAKKLLENPTLKLKFAKWLDGLNDAKKAAVVEDLKNGVVPKGITIKSSTK